MIIEYHRPHTREDALALLSRPEPRTVVIGGGLYLNQVAAAGPLAVVDLQNLDLGTLKIKGKSLHLGGSATLQTILDFDPTPLVLKKAIQQQENFNRRQVATLAGTLVAGNGRSAISAVLLALDPVIVLEGKDQESERHPWGDLLPLREQLLAGKLITEIIVPINIACAYDFAARSPADLPVVAAAVSKWPSGRTRVVLAGYGDQPIMVFDGPDGMGADSAARDAYSEAEDQWASAAYRSDTAAVLVKRCLKEIDEG